MHPDQEINRDLQIFEHTLQQILMQKQSLHLEQNELSNALSELNKASDPVFRVIGSVMIKADKNDLKKELDEKKRVIDLKIGAMEKQESLIDLNLNLDKLNNLKGAYIMINNNQNVFGKRLNAIPDNWIKLYEIGDYPSQSIIIYHAK